MSGIVDAQAIAIRFSTDFITGNKKEIRKKIDPNIIFITQKGTQKIRIHNGEEECLKAIKKTWKNIERYLEFNFQPKNFTETSGDLHFTNICVITPDYSITCSPLNVDGIDFALPEDESSSSSSSPKQPSPTTLVMRATGIQTFTFRQGKIIALHVIENNEVFLVPTDQVANSPSMINRSKLSSSLAALSSPIIMLSTNAPKFSYSITAGEDNSCTIL